MHKATQSNSQDGGLFSRKGSIFGGGSRRPPTRPGTSSGYTTTASDSNGDSVASQDSTASSTSSVPPPKASSSSNAKSPQNTRKPSIEITNFSNSPEKRPEPARSRSRLRANSRSADRRQSISQPSGDTSIQLPPAHAQSSQRASTSSTAPYSNMLAASINRNAQDYRPDLSFQAGRFGAGAMVPGMAPPVAGPQSPTLETITFQHIHEMASKRISTLDYLRKAYFTPITSGWQILTSNTRHEGRVYWFNTLLFNKPDLARMSYFDSRKLARRATNYLLLGLSLPTILDLNSSTPVDFLRTLNALLAEFDAFQTIHPPDGSSSSSLSRARLPQMFKRTNTGGKGRRTSSAAEIGLPMSSYEYDTKSIAGSISSVASSTVTSFPSNDNDLLPGEEYTYLLTPSLPFDPDFYETFATLCDVLIDCYTRLMSLIASPKECGPHIAEMFTKADGRIRKIIVQGVVKEFEENSRSGVKSEVAGVGKVVLGGLM
jgi:hypothetical protein